MTKPSRKEKLYVRAIRESGVRALGSVILRDTSTLTVDAACFNPPACSMKSSSDSLSAYL